MGGPMHAHNKSKMADGRHFKIQKSLFLRNGWSYGNETGIEWLQDRLWTALIL